MRHGCLPAGHTRLDGLRRPVRSEGAEKGHPPRLLNRQEDTFAEIVVYPTILVLVTSAATAPTLARALATVGDCAYDGRRLRLQKTQEWEGDGIWDEGLEAAADGHEKEI